MTEVHPPSGMSIRYLRRKPGKGLAIVYEGAPGAWITVSLEEAEAAAGKFGSGLARRRVPAPRTAANGTNLTQPVTGAVARIFPADVRLTGLAECCAPAAG